MKYNNPLHVWKQAKDFFIKPTINIQILDKSKLPCDIMDKWFIKRDVEFSVKNNIYSFKFLPFIGIKITSNKYLCFLYKVNLDNLDYIYWDTLLNYLYGNTMGNLKASILKNTGKPFIKKILNKKGLQKYFNDNNEVDFFN